MECLKLWVKFSIFSFDFLWGRRRRVESVIFRIYGRVGMRLVVVDFGKWFLCRLVVLFIVVC